MGLSRDDLLALLRNYTRLEQAAATMFGEWAQEATEPEMRETLLEFAEIEQRQAAMIATHFHELGGRMEAGPVPLEDAIQQYLRQVGMLSSLGERLRFNCFVMNTLERPVVMQALLEATSPKTLEMFKQILKNEDRILSWCDSTATELGFPAVEIDRYFAGMTARSAAAQGEGYGSQSG